MSAFLFVRDPRMEEIWPFVPERLIAGLRGLGETRVVELERNERLSDAADLGDVVGIAWFGGRFSEACAEAATQLRMVGCNTDNTGHGLPLEQLRSRAIPVVDTTRAWAQSVAEIALGLAISGLRRIPQWHAELASGQPSFCYQAQQFCDAQGFVGGELGSRRVGVLGLGQIGGRVARWCVALARDAATGPDGGDRVLGCDPYLPPGRAESWGVTLVDPDRLVEESEVLFVTTPPTPSATRLLSEARIGRLRKGALVVIVTRAHAVDMAALRRRVL
ncbi:MAG: hypothetical protein FJX77_07085, partial [Armatimonadetes bacterium]|nr:hypothetical protein [Armatimonadota bacterium]